MKLALQIVLPILVILAGVMALSLMIAGKPQATSIAATSPPPLVRAIIARAQSLRVTIHSQGNVAPRHEIDLVPEISGKVIHISDSLIAGGFFAAGEALLTIDRRDFELAVTQKRAKIAEERYHLKMEQAEAASAKREWAELGQGQEPDPLVLREPQLAEARAFLAAAEAALQQAVLDLERTVLIAPFAGRVRSEQVGIGQYVTSGSPLAHIYAIDSVEVRLPVPNMELAFLDLPLRDRGTGNVRPRPEVILHAEFAGESFSWTGRIVRTDGQIDSHTRQVTLIAQVDDPYGQGDDPDRPPLVIGMYVAAEIQGRIYQQIIKLPRSAVRAGNRVLVIDADDRLHFRQIDILRHHQDLVLVRGGIVDGERICLSPIEQVTDGMRVTVDITASPGN